MIINKISPFRKCWFIKHGNKNSPILGVVFLNSLNNKSEGYVKQLITT